MAAHRTAIRMVARPALRIRAVRQARDERVRQAFERGRRLPWSSGYVGYRNRFVDAVLDDTVLLRRFAEGTELPRTYGVALDERCIEYPWLFARLAVRDGRLLDAGSILNHEHLVSRPEVRARQLHILTLAPERTAFWRLGISYLYADLREIPIRDDYYDEIACISTLEHVGCDNSMYVADGTSFEVPDGDRRDAMVELGRVLKPGGSLFVTVPFGKRQDHGSFIQFDAAALAELVDSFPGNVASATFYRYASGGWQATDQADCAGAEYSREVALAFTEGRAPDPDRLDEDRAAAARAVACLELRKPRASAK